MKIGLLYGCTEYVIITIRSNTNNRANYSAEYEYEYE